MGKEILMFGNIEIEKNKFYHHKSLVPVKDVDIEEVLLSNKISSGKKNFKYFIGYLYDYYKIKPLRIMLPKASAYIKSYGGQTKWMYLLTEDDDLLVKYNTTWDKFSANIKNSLIASLSTVKNF